MSQAHWDSVYATEHLDELGWYEPMPSTLGLVTAYSTPGDSVIDVGGGTSPLTLELARLGYRDLTVLDISERALGASRDALGEHAEVVSRIRADLTSYLPNGNSGTTARCSTSSSNRMTGRRIGPSQRRRWSQAES